MRSRHATKQAQQGKEPNLFGAMREALGATAARWQCRGHKQQPISKIFYLLP